MLFRSPYEALKKLTRKNKKIGKDELHEFIDGLALDEELKSYMKRISPHNYTGKVPDFSKLPNPDKV